MHIRMYVYHRVSQLSRHAKILSARDFLKPAWRKSWLLFIYLKLLFNEVKEKRIVVTFLKLKNCSSFWAEKNCCYVTFVVTFGITAQKKEPLVYQIDFSWKLIWRQMLILLMIYFQFMLLIIYFAVQYFMFKGKCMSSSVKL